VKRGTIDLYIGVLKRCEELFELKAIDYGMSWRVLRLQSITDQILIKLKRIQTIVSNNSQAVLDSVEDDLIGVINYCIIAIMQCHILKTKDTDLMPEDVSFLHRRVVDEITLLFLRKNHDYDESWRMMRFDSVIDIMLMKVMRLKNIENRGGEIVASEGVEANYQDIVNYAVIASIKLNEAVELSTS
jgi:hypothetical protein